MEADWLVMMYCTRSICCLQLNEVKNYEHFSKQPMNVICKCFRRRCKITSSGFVHVMSSRSQMNLSRNVSLKGREVG